MKAGALLWTAAAGFLFAGCAWLDRDDGTPPSTSGNVPVTCSQTPCPPIQVTVTACVVTITPASYRVGKGVKGATIVWDVQTPNVTFPSQPIRWKKESQALAEREFTNPRLLRDGRGFSWDDGNSQPATFNYGVNVIQDGKACPPMDPTIINDGP
jgi:hypothetical protein